MTNWVVLNTYSEITDEGDGDDDIYSWHGGDTLYITGAYITRDEFKRDYNSIETELEHGFVVAVAYTDGGTFGYDGHCDILEVFESSQEARDFIEVAKGSSTNGPKHQSLPWTFEYSGKTYHRSWLGYFAGLTSLDYYEF